MINTDQKINTFLMFDGCAEEAMEFYISLFSDSEILSLQRYGADDAAMEGRVLHAAFTLNGQVFRCIDSNIRHEFTFTPAMSLYVNCNSTEEIDRVFQQLAQDGKVLMPLGEYPFSSRFGWVADRFGVTWQLNFPNEQ